MKRKGHRQRNLIGLLLEGMRLEEDSACALRKSELNPLSTRLMIKQNQVTRVEVER